MRNIEKSIVSIEDTALDNLIAGEEAARTATANPGTHLLVDAPKIARVYTFVVMHMSTQVRSESASFRAEYEFAGALEKADWFERNTLMSEFTVAWLRARGIDWGSVEILGEAVRYDHGCEDSYHYCFRALVTD
jgi:hypothetical protein